MRVSGVPSTYLGQKDLLLRFRCGWLPPGEDESSVYQKSGQRWKKKA